MSYIFTAILAFAFGYLVGGTRAHIANQRYLDKVDEQIRKHKG